MVYLSVPGLKALGWTFVAIGILLTIGRYTVRWMLAGLNGAPANIRRFKADDALHLLGLCGSITYVALQSSGLSIFIQVEKYNESHQGHVDLADEAVFFRIRFGAVLIFWITMYSIKFAFLMLYRSLFWVSVPFRRAWYAIATFTFFCFLANFLACFWVCGYPIAPTSLTQCLKKHSKTQNDIEYLWVALNTASSLLVLMLPLAMLRGLQMALSKKLSLAALFTVGGLDIFFDIFRTWYTTTSVGVQNLWEIVEITVAVMLSAVVAFRQVFTLRQRKAELRNSRTKYSGNTSAHTNDTKRSGKVSTSGRTTSEDEEHRWESTDRMIPMTEREHV